MAVPDDKAKQRGDWKLLGTETPQEQVDRMGAGWSIPGQYEKQLQLPVHSLREPVLEQVVRDGRTMNVAVYRTGCGIELGTVTLRSSEYEDDVTCQACLAGDTSNISDEELARVMEEELKK